ncbi:MAG: restriction endonuclease subunit S [Treponema sp.]|jgi:type I restriction enzyme S subunit|nr:restriction endonuclease subunit S [Treponema sp.]
MLIPFSKIASTQKGKNPPLKSKEKIVGYIPYIDIKAFEQGIFKTYTDGNKCLLCDDGDILLVWDGARAGLVGTAYKGAVGSTLIKIDVPLIEKKYVLYFLQFYSRELNAQPKGTGIPHINPNIFNSLPFPLSPLPEQHRIVAKIDSLFSELDNGVALLKTIKTQLAIYRQAALKWVFEGKKDYVSFGEITEMRLGKMLDKNKNKGIPEVYLRNINVRWFDFDLDDLLEMKFEEDEEDKYSIKKGDLTICEGGEPGRCAIWKSDETIKYQKALHRVRPKEDFQAGYLMYYMKYITNSGVINNFFTGTGIKHLTGESLKKIPVPICSKPEQLAIVSAIESRLSVCDKLEQTIDQTLALSASLRQSILKKAFEGRLVPQDPNDEPAEKLLERIKAEKAAVLANQKQTRKRDRK